VTVNVEKALMRLRGVRDWPIWKLIRPSFARPRHHPRSRKSFRCDARGLRAGDHHSGGLSLRLADGAHQHDGDPPVADGGRSVLHFAGANDEHDGHRRPRHRARRSGRDDIIDVENILRRLRLIDEAAAP